MPVLATPIERLERMWRIRAFEETCSRLFAEGRVPGLLHLSIGQEGTAVGLASVLTPADRLFGGHRAHALARGADPTRLLAEICGKASGYCGGKGGSMHISAPEAGFVTATGVVAGNDNPIWPHRADQIWPHPPTRSVTVRIDRVQAVVPPPFPLRPFWLARSR